MGADMVVAVISYRRRESDNKQGWDAEFHKRVEAVREACKAGNWFGDAGGIENYYDTIHGDLDKPKHFENAKQEVMDEFMAVINEFEECLCYRDVGTFSYPERFIIFSGGMSYGEEPTESYTRIDKFSALPPTIIGAGGFE